MSRIRVSAGTTKGFGSHLVIPDGSGGIQFGYSSHTLTAQIKPVQILEIGKFESANSVQTASGAANLSLQRFRVPAGITATRIDFLDHYTVAGSTANTFQLRLALYTMSGSTASLASSASAAVTHNSGTNSTAASIYGGLSGTQWRSYALASWAVTPGEYMMGVMMSQSGEAGTTGSHTLYGASAISIAGFGALTNANPADMFSGGVFSAGTASPPASIHISDVNRTGSYALAQPGFRFVGSF